MEVDPPQGQGAAADAAEGAPKPAQQQLESTEQQTQGEAGVSGSGEADAAAEMVDPPVNGTTPRQETGRAQAELGARATCRLAWRVVSVARTARAAAAVPRD